MTADLPLAPEYLEVLDSSLDPLGIVDGVGIYVWVNEAGARFFGYAREEVVGTHFRDHLREDETPGEAMQRAQDGNPAAVVRHVRRKDGSEAVVRTELIPLGSGFVLIHATDLTALYQTLAEVRESEGVLSRAQEIGHTASWVLRLPEGSVRWFGRLDDLLGFAPEALVTGDEAATHVLHAEDRGVPRRIVDEAIATGSSSGVFRTVHPQKGPRWLRMYAQSAAELEPDRVRIEGVVHDITGDRERDERYRELLEAVRVPMLIWTPQDGSTPPAMLYVNDALCEFLQEPPEALLGQAPRDWVDEPEREAAIAYIGRVLQGDGSDPAPFLLTVRRKDGTARTCLLTAARVTYEGRPALCGQIIDLGGDPPPRTGGTGAGDGPRARRRGWRRARLQQHPDGHPRLSRPGLRGTGERIH